MKIYNKTILIILSIFIISGCGKVGPLNLPEDKIDKSVITYPCDAVCKQKFEDEKERQQSVTIQSN